MAFFSMPALQLKDFSRVTSALSMPDAGMWVPSTKSTAWLHVERQSSRFDGFNDTETSPSPSPHTHSWLNFDECGKLIT